MSVNSPNNQWDDGHHIVRTNELNINESPDGNGSYAMHQGAELEDIIKFDDPRGQVFELAWARFNVFINANDVAGAEAVHFLNFEVTTEDTVEQTVSWRQHKTLGGSTDSLTWTDVSTGTTHEGDVNATQTYLEERDALWIAAPHQQAMNTTAGAGGTLHMAHEHMDYRDISGGLGPILYPSDSINHFMNHHHAGGDSGGWSIYIEEQLFGWLHEDDDVFGP